MKITKTSPLTGVKRTYDLPVTQDQLLQYVYGMGTLREIFPHLSDNERMFIATGVTVDELGQE